jgi:hypothetical protein
MGRIADVAAEMPPASYLGRQGPRCWAERQTVSDEDRAELADLMAQTYSATELVDLLTRAGFRVSESQIKHHRSGACRCGQDR